MMMATAMTRRKERRRPALLLLVLIKSSWTVMASDWNTNTQQQQQPPPRRPPPPPRQAHQQPWEQQRPSEWNEWNVEQQQQQRTPIHYNFPSAEKQQNNNPHATARRDCVTNFVNRSTNHRLLLVASCGLVGRLFGTFLGHALPIPASPLVSTISMVLFLLYSSVRNPYGELVRALGMLLILSGQRFVQIRRDYPVPILTVLGQRRKPFPKTTNDDTTNTVYYNKLYCLAAMAFVGSTIGGNIPIIPRSLGGLIGAGVCLMLTLPDTATGDVCRSMGMRVVALIREMIGMNAQLQLLSKTGVVSGKIFDKIMILDRQHRIKEKIIDLFGLVANQVSNWQGEGSEEEEDRRPRNGPDRPLGADGRRRPPDYDNDSPDRPARRPPSKDKRRPPPSARERQRVEDEPSPRGWFGRRRRLPRKQEPPPKNSRRGRPPPPPRPPSVPEEDEFSLPPIDNDPWESYEDAKQ